MKVQLLLAILLVGIVIPCLAAPQDFGGRPDLNRIDGNRKAVQQGNLHKREKRAFLDAKTSKSMLRTRRETDWLETAREAIEALEAIREVFALVGNPGGPVFGIDSAFSLSDE